MNLHLAGSFLMPVSVLHRSGVRFVCLLWLIHYWNRNTLILLHMIPLFFLFFLFVCSKLVYFYHNVVLRSAHLALCSGAHENAIKCIIKKLLLLKLKNHKYKWPTTTSLLLIIEHTARGVDVERQPEICSIRIKENCTTLMYVYVCIWHLYCKCKFG